jgi:hypothetical protein
MNSQFENLRIWQIRLDNFPIDLLNKFIMIQYGKTKFKLTTHEFEMLKTLYSIFKFSSDKPEFEIEIENQKPHVFNPKTRPVFYVITAQAAKMMTSETVERGILELANIAGKPKFIKLQTPISPLNSDKEPTQTYPNEKLIDKYQPQLKLHRIDEVYADEVFTHGIKLVNQLCLEKERKLINHNLKKRKKINPMVNIKKPKIDNNVKSNEITHNSKQPKKRTVPEKLEIKNCSKKLSIINKNEQIKKIILLHDDLEMEIIDVSDAGCPLITLV